ncbi:MAG: FtsX-like permease family protein [Holophagaceae bacterium]|nr:FtsX-like permease family protein [Holophagaceae bacterium]
MTWLVLRIVLRAMLRERGRVLLALLSVALGVSVFLSIRLANRAAVASFAGFAAGIGQGSDLVVRAEAGPLRETALPALRGLRDEAWIRPVIEGTFSRRGVGGGAPEGFQLLGTDLVGLAGSAPATAEPPDAGSGSMASSGEGDGGAAGNFYRSLQDPAAVLVSTALARAEGLRIGSALSGFVNGRPVTLAVAGIAQDAPNRPPLQRNLLVMDLPAAQMVLGRPGELDRVELGLRGEASLPALELAAAAALPPGWVLEAPETRASSARTMTAAFRFNLTILSLIALAVGAYLLFQAFDAAVNRRRETWATLRSLGCPPRLLNALVLLEAALLGVAGSAAGVLLGWGMAQGAVRAVSKTVDTLYGASAARSAQLWPSEAALAFGLGTLTCLAAAWLPARTAAATVPVQLLARGSGTRPARWQALSAAGLLLALAGAGLAFLPVLPAGVAWHAYAGSGLVLLGGSLATLALLPLLGLPGGRRAPWAVRLALRPLRRPTGRHGFAAAALAVAVGMTIGMGVMVKSFEATVMTWIGTNLRADLYVAPLGSEGMAAQHRLSAALAESLAADPAVLAADRFQVVPLRLRGAPTFLGAADFNIHGRHGHVAIIEGGDPNVLLPHLHDLGLADPSAIASETFTRRFGVRLGDALEIPTPSGLRRLTVRGVYADYGNERGSLIVDRPVFLDWFHDDRVASLALYLRPGLDPNREGKRLFAAHPGLQFRSNASLRQQVTTIFHQTFALTYALEVIGLGVALAGLVQALLGLALARRGDIWTLRTLGAKEGEIAAVLLGEGLGVALAGTLGGLAMGVLLAQILVRVLNPQVFGWTLRFALPGPFMGLVLALTLLAAVLALLPAARWAARLRADREAEEGA